MCVCVKLLSCVQLFTHQAPLSMGFSRQEDWSVIPFSPPGDLPDPGIELMSPVLQVNSLPTEPAGKPKMSLPYAISPSFSPILSSGSFIGSDKTPAV